MTFEAIELVGDKTSGPHRFSEQVTPSAPDAEFRLGCASPYHGRELAVAHVEVGRRRVGLGLAVADRADEVALGCPRDPPDYGIDIYRSNDEVPIDLAERVTAR